MKGSVFDIKRFAMHDGEGIRTTVFLKGCPLSCVWCQNPEGISLKKRPLYFENKCIHCMTCVHVAKKGGVTTEDGKITLHIDAKEDWNKIVDACPAVAIAMDSKEYTVEEVLAEVNKEKAFYKYDGGVTLSGGEPLMQSQFAIELLRTFKNEGINTAIETALHVKSETVEEMLKYIDSIYADFKIYDDSMHKKYVGVSNEQIKKNLKLILTSEKKDSVIIRTPLIPELTATEENLTCIARFVSDIYPEVKYELLNYNPLAEAKYHLVDKEYYFKDNPKLYTKEQMKAFGDIVTNAGIKNLILEI
jgi:pyruvate formate lyase activating enzyme